MQPIILLTLFLHISLAYSPPQKPLSSQSQNGPSLASATENANLIFNAIYASMRQWGSSVQHNGMSFFPASIPAGTLLYHGHHTPDRVVGIEWLAFEIPHAEMFARGWKKRNQTGGGEGGQADEHDEFVDLRSTPPQLLWGLEKPEQPQYGPRESVPGYLHIYQATRPLKVLYIDGMAAANSELGTLDTQDLLLLNFTSGVWAERQRAKELCDLGEKWGIEGFIRMECGFELIKCDFSTGLDFISHKERPNESDPQGRNDIFLLDFVRDIANRYHGIDGGRVHLDYSSMVSAFFYAANLSNPHQDPRAGPSALPRLVESDDQVLQRIRSDLGHSLRNSKAGAGVDWQGVADMIVKRYAARLQWMATGMEQETFLSQVNIMMNTFVDYGISEGRDPVTVCSEHYLQPVEPSTEQDRLIEAALKVVTRRICNTLWEVRKILLQKEDDTLEAEATSSAVELVRDLISRLDWSDWKACGQCKVDEVCFIAFFPFGTADDHYNPHCVNSTELQHRSRGTEDNYW